MTDHTTTENRTATSTWITWAILLTILLAAAAIRWRLLDVPLERDEGEYAYAGQLILDGVPPYRDVYNMKLPGIYAAYAGVLAIFGRRSGASTVGLLVVNSVTILLVFVLARQLVDDFTGLVAAASFAPAVRWASRPRCLRKRGAFCTAAGAGGNDHASLGPLLRSQVAACPQWTAAGVGVCGQAARSGLCRVWWRLSVA